MPLTGNWVKWRLGPARPFAFCDQFPNRWNQLFRYSHDGLSRILICRLILGDRLFFRLLLVMLADRDDPPPGSQAGSVEKHHPKPIGTIEDTHNGLHFRARQNHRHSVRSHE